MRKIPLVSDCKKITWPSRKTVAKNTGAVFVFGTILMAFIMALDFGATNLFRLIVSIF